MIVTSVQIKTAKTQKHLYCPVFTVESLDTQSAYRGFFFYKALFLAFKRHLFHYLLTLKIPLLSTTTGEVFFD